VAVWSLEFGVWSLEFGVWSLEVVVVCEMCLAASSPFWRAAAAGTQACVCLFVCASLTPFWERFPFDGNLLAVIYFSGKITDEFIGILYFPPIISNFITDEL